MKEKLVLLLRRFGAWLIAWLRPGTPSDTALPVDAARMLAERQRLSEILPYRDFDADGLFLTEDLGEFRLGFTLQYWPWMQAGADGENQVEGLISAVNVANATIQFGVLSHPWIKPMLDRWADARSSGDEAIAGLAESRRMFMLAAAHDISLLEEWGYHPKEHMYVMTVTLPYRGELTDTTKWEEFSELVRRYRATLIGTFRGMQMKAEPIHAGDLRWLLRTLVNPHIPIEAQVRDSVQIGEEKGATALVDRETRVTVRTDGLLMFEASCDPDEKRRRYVACVTVDGYPKKSYLPLTARLLNGTVNNAREHVSTPFWHWINIVVPDADRSADRFTVKAAGIARQLISDSPSYRALMAHLVDMQEEVQQLRTALSVGQTVVYASMGINLVGTSPQVMRQAISETTSAWKKHGFRASPERYIHLPVWLASLPGVLTPKMDPVENRGGLQRGSSMTSHHAATLAPMQGEWTGTPPQGGGLLMLSRRGMPAFFNVQDKSAGANYNFCMVAKSGSGKSFAAQELILDFLAKKGYAFVIDAGKSYFELCELLGGTNLVFRMDDPIDLNPFSAITEYSRLKEMMEMLKELIRYMAFPQSAVKGVDDWQEAIIEHAIEAVWHQYKAQTTIPKIRDWLGNNEDRRARDIADQLRPYAEGRLASWFDGSGRKVNMRSHFTVVELDDLKGQGMFRNIVLTMVMQRIAETMYGLGDPSIPKLMMIDEAWDLLSSLQTGDFIERAYRTYRKYGGSAGVITQGFNDFKKSAAAMAAYANSSWLFALAQKAESLEMAFKEGLVYSNDEGLRELLKSVHTYPGKYSEIFVRGEQGQGVFRFITDPYAYWLFTTAPHEKSIRTKKLEEVQKKYPDWPRGRALAEAVRALAAESTKKRFGKTPEEALAHMADYVPRGV